MTLINAKKSDEVLGYLLNRRSLTVINIDEPGPSENEIEQMITAACRVPDHGKLSPFYFITFSNDKRSEIGPLLKKAYKTEDPNASEAKLELESKRFERAPTVILVISRIRQSKIQAWEQILCAGAACQNLILASHALGYSAQWLTEWYSYNTVFKDGLGLEEGREHIAGAIYIGTPKKEPEERARPNIEDLINTYDKNRAPKNRGDTYEKADKGFADHGFSLPKG